MGSRARRVARIEILDHPGERLDAGTLAALEGALRAAGGGLAAAPEPPPRRPARSSAAVAILAVARDDGGAVVGFATADRLVIDGVGDVLFLGASGASPDAGAADLAPRLIGRVVLSQLLVTRPLGRLWLAHLGATPALLGSVAEQFDDIYPSPFARSGPGSTHRRIAAAITHRHRARLGIRQDARFDARTFVFRGRATGAPPPHDDAAGRHRHPLLNDYYAALLRDEPDAGVLQIGSASLLTAFGALWRRHALRRAAPPGAGELAAA